MIETHFTSRDIAFLVAGIFCALLAAWLFYKGKTRLSIVLLIVAGLSFRLMMAFIDPFVNIWDEQYHALVAKNLSEHFFHPTLVENPVLPLDRSYWAFTHTWLHKPPLFLWQMAVAIKIFGASAWAIRLPSVLLSVLMIPAIYRMGKLVSGERIGFLAALLLTCSNIHINIVSGFLNTDQNDVVFAAYVLFSFWTWTEYLYNPSRRWIVLTGVFVAAAVLTKWLPGLLVFGAWGTAIIFIRDFRNSPKRWKDFAGSIVIAACVACPWFLYAALTWPVEWGVTMNHYTDHLSQDMSHTGPWWYHFKELQGQFGRWFIILLVPAFVIFLRSSASKGFKLGATASVVCVFAFYSFVPIRMPFFCFMVMPLLFLAMAYLIDFVFQWIQSKRPKVYAPLFAIVVLFFILKMTNIGRLEHFHTDRDPKEFYRKTRLHNLACFERIKNTLPVNSVVFNCGTWNAVPCMFYTSYTAYDYLPDANTIAEAKKQARTVAVFDDGQLPEYIAQDSSIVILKEELIRNGY